MKRRDAKKYEKEFSYGKGLIPTPSDWIAHFWDVHNEQIKKIIDAPLKAANSILFVGVGSGGVMTHLDFRGKTVIGIDLNVKYLLQAPEYCKKVEADSSSIPFKDGSFDMVICDKILHHVVVQGSLEETIAECSRVLKDGGRMFAVEPNLFHPSGLAMTLMNKFHLYHKIAGGSDYERALSPFKLTRMCRSYFKKIRVNAVTFGHPRFPLSFQKLIFRADKYLKRMYLLSFSFAVEAVK